MLGKGTAPIQGFVVLKALEVASTDLLGAISYLPNLLRGASGLRVRGVVVLWGGRGYSPGDLPGCTGLLRLLLLLRVLLLTWIRILDVRTGTGVMPLVVLRVLGILAVLVVLVAGGIVHQHRVVAVLWVLIILVVMLVLLVVVVVLRVVGVLAFGGHNIAQPYTGIFKTILLLMLLLLFLLFLLFDGTTTRIMVSRIVVGILALGRGNIAQPYALIF